jgi:hypothetical protein
MFRVVAVGLIWNGIGTKSSPSLSEELFLVQKVKKARTWSSVSWTIFPLGR